MEADGYNCTTKQLIDVLLAVSCQKDTIEQVCNDLQIKVGAETCRGYFNSQLEVENLSVLQEAVNRTLQTGFSNWLKEKDLDVAIDFHDQPYYGKSEQTKGLWVSGQAKSGTNKFYRIATAYVIRNGQRLTLAIKFVVPDDTTKGVVEYLMKQLEQLEIKVGCLYLDRGFALIEIIRYFKQIKQKAIIACPLRGRKGGTKGLCVGRKSYRTKHIFKSNKCGKEEAEIAMFKGFTTSKRSGKKKKRKVKWLAYILIGCEENLSAKKIKEKYRSRFGIETSYRCSRKVRGWTTSKNTAYRFILIGMSFVLTNIWQELQEKWTRKRQVGRRVWKWKKFRLKRFINFLRTAIENLYGMVNKIEMLN